MVVLFSSQLDTESHRKVTDSLPDGIHIKEGTTKVLHRRSIKPKIPVRNINESVSGEDSRKMLMILIGVH